MGHCFFVCFVLFLFSFSIMYEMKFKAEINVNKNHNLSVMNTANNNKISFIQP